MDRTATKIIEEAEEECRGRRMHTVRNCALGLYISETVTGWRCILLSRELDYCNAEHKEESRRYRRWSCRDGTSISPHKSLPSTGV